MENQKEEPIVLKFKASKEIETYREKQLKFLDEVAGEKENETYVRKSRPLDCLDVRQTLTPEQAHEYFQKDYDVDKLVRYCFRSTILQLKRGVLNGITIENFRKEKGKK